MARIYSKTHCLAVPVITAFYKVCFQISKKNKTIFNGNDKKKHSQFLKLAYLRGKRTKFEPFFSLNMKFNYKASLPNYIH